MNIDCENFHEISLTPASRIRAKRFQEILGNCNYAVEVARKLNLVVVGIAGSDLMEANPTLTLAIVWQLMRAYTLALLSRLGSDTPVTEAEIVAWANNRAGLAIKNFQDKVHTFMGFFFKGRSGATLV